MLKVAWAYANDALQYEQGFGLCCFKHRTGRDQYIPTPTAQFPFAFFHAYSLHNSLLKWISHSTSHLSPHNRYPSEDRSSRRENSQCGFFLRWIFGKWADSLEHRCCEMQLPSHKAFSFSWSTCSFQACLIQRLWCSYLMMSVPSRAMSLRLPSLPCCSWYVLLVLPAPSSYFWKLLSSSWYLGDQCSSGALSVQPVLAPAQGRRGSTRQRSLRKIHWPLQTKCSICYEQT